MWNVEFTKGPSNKQTIENQKSKDWVHLPRWWVSNNHEGFKGNGKFWAIMRSCSKCLCCGSLMGTCSRRRWDDTALCGREEVLGLQWETDKEVDIVSQVCQIRKANCCPADASQGCYPFDVLEKRVWHFRWPPCACCQVCSAPSCFDHLSIQVTSSKPSLSAGSLQDTRHQAFRAAAVSQVNTAEVRDELDSKKPGAISFLINPEETLWEQEIE